MQLVVGRIGKAHGIRGEVNVSLRTDEPEDRFAIGSVIVTDPPERGPLTVTSMRFASGRLVVGFKEVADRTAAEKYQGTMLVVDTDDLPAIDDDDEYYDHELVGMRAVISESETDSDTESASELVVGVVIDVVHGSGGDTLVIKPAGSHGRRELLIPFVRAIVPTVDRAARVIYLDPPDGLLDL
ncbi:16S rRNA processing protein RimM [Antricoccus suffuscus]|uniref:Ribosome maturation factor RimM n=1 Tax=Antricoccus suffuscus TaxID=1629062 RepID=A0A2T1A4K1_9ACTN|nr:ribosome maturation factor RimM [Antricoccus suffuscus]PRZ43530.1 16S rRNA processing protein RimM [Antricoccus suffuscus]